MLWISSIIVSGVKNLTPSIEKAFATDLTKASPLTQDEAEEAVSRARSLILKSFAEDLPAVVDGYKQLALTADDEEVRRKASERILDTFLPPPQAKLQQAPGTTIQILNALPIPEVKMVEGREAPHVEIGQVKYALTSPKKRTISPAEEPKKRERYLGPTSMQGDAATGGSSPAPIEIPTPITKG